MSNSETNSTKCKPYRDEEIVFNYQALSLLMGLIALALLQLATCLLLASPITQQQEIFLSALYLSLALFCGHITAIPSVNQ